MSEKQDTSGTRRGHELPTGAVMVGMAIIVWWPAFTLGVWGELFFDQVLTVWAASTAALVFVLVERGPVRVRVGRALLLALPSVWLVLMFVLNDDTHNVIDVLLAVGAIVTVLVGIPFTLWVLVRIMWPDFGETMSRGTKTLIASVVIGVAVVSFVLGMNHPGFLTCEDFHISGNSPPANCTPEPVPAAVPAD